MRKRRRWLWITLFVVLAVFLAVAATIWNVVLVRQYLQLVDFGKELAAREHGIDVQTPFVASLVVGGLMTVAALAGLGIFFARLLREMRFSQLQTEFLARLSHELKSPVTSLDLTASLLQAGPASEEERVKLWRIHDSELHRLRVEIDTLLEASHWETKGFQPTLHALNLEEWLESATHRWRQILGADGALTRSGEKLDVVSNLDARLLDLITNNIIDNARKFASPGRGPQVEVRTAVITPDQPGEGLRWSLSLRDGGVGFDPKVSKKIFERFFRARVRGPYAIPGTGLGLFLAGAAARTLRLKLEASSAGEGQGATFTLSGEAEA